MSDFSRLDGSRFEEEYEDDSSTSSDDSSSSKEEAGNWVTQTSAPPPRSRGRRRNEPAAAVPMDAAAYQRACAREEWLRATGQTAANDASPATPSPPARSGAPQSSSPNAKRAAQAAAATTSTTFLTEEQTALAIGSERIKQMPASAGTLEVARGAAVRPSSARGRMNSADDPLVRHQVFATGLHVDPARLGETFSSTPSQYSSNRMTKVEAPKDAVAVVQPVPIQGISGSDTETQPLNPGGSSASQLSSRVVSTPNGTVQLGIAPPAGEGKAADKSKEDFLRLLDLLGSSEDVVTANLRAAETEREVEHHQKLQAVARAEAEHAQRATTERHLRTHRERVRQAFHERVEKWRSLDDDTPFVAERESHEAEAACAQPLDIQLVSQQLLNSERYFVEQQQAMLRFESAVDVLEDLVVSSKFVAKVNRFLQKHHKIFLSTLPQRQLGEHSHREFEVFTEYRRLIHGHIVEVLSKEVDGFNEDEFFDRVFDASIVHSEGEAMSGNHPVTPAASDGETATKWSSRGELARNVTAWDASEQSALSYEVWEVLLSFMKFELFNELMDEFIGSYYGTTVASAPAALAPRVNAESVVGTAPSFRRTPSPSATATAKRSLREMKNLPKKK